MALSLLWCVFAPQRNFLLDKVSKHSCVPACLDRHNRGAAKLLYRGEDVLQCCDSVLLIRQAHPTFEQE
jgi:hypothetical protein